MKKLTRKQQTDLRDAVKRYMGGCKVWFNNRTEYYNYIDYLGYTDEMLAIIEEHGFNPDSPTDYAAFRDLCATYNIKFEFYANLEQWQNRGK
jgi:hypothetical protein